ncbi:MAG TPA: caspase family protein [Xanthobacteraceae bacterium]|jgi:tetratricopeptide (TPR) repeat protein
MHPLLSIVSLAFMLIAVSAPPAAADDRTCFSGAYTGPVWDDRVAACTRLIAEKKDLVRAYVQRGRLYVRRGDNWDQAIADFAEALRLDPKNVEALSLHGVLTFNRGDTARAVAEMNEAIQLNPKSAVARNSIAFFHNAKGDYDRALAELNEAIRLDPKFGYAYKNRGISYENKGEFDKALADFRMALNLDPEKKERLGRDAAQGIERIQQKLAAAGGSRPAPGASTDDQAVCFRGAVGNETSAACTRLIGSGKLSGGELGRAFYQRAMVSTRNGNFDAAMADSNEAVRLDPNNVNARALRAAGYIGKGDYDRALTDLKEARRLDPKSFLTANVFGVYYNSKGEYDRALTELNEAIRLNPNGMYAYKNRGITYEHKGEHDKALADFRKALSFDPEGKERVGREAWEGIERVQQKLAALRVKPAPTVAPTPAPTVAPTSPSLVTALPTDSRRRVALVIGNGKYQFAAPLPNPPNDAADIAKALRKLGFDVVEGRDLDRPGMDNAIRQFGRKLDGADIALFFYAGHGLQVNGKNYLVPVDAKLERPGDLTLDAVDISTVLAQMEAEKRVNLIFLDACRDNPLARSLARSLGTRSSAVGQGLASIQSAIGTMIAYATQPDNVALDGEGRNSPFTAALLKHLVTPGLEIGALMKRVRADVIAATREKQVPWDHSSLVGDVILMK